MRRILPCLSICIFLFISLNALAQVTAVPSAMNFQGRLARPDGTPVPDGTYSIHFSLWNALTTGTENWNQTINPVTVRNGAFSVQLSGFPTGTFNSNQWLEIKIGSNLPLTPRQQLVTVPYAFKADLALTVPDGSITAAKLALGVIPASLPPSGTAGGDLTGTYPNPLLATLATSLFKVSGGNMSIQPGSAVVVDQQQTSATSQRTVPAGTDVTVWQSFQPAVSGNLSRIDIVLGSPSSRTVRLLLYAGEGVSGTPLASYFFSLGTAVGFRGYVFAAPVSVVGGQTYTLAIQGQDMILGQDSTNPYSRGQSGTGATAVPGTDLAFRTYLGGNTTITSSPLSAYSGNAVPALTGISTIGGSNFGAVTGIATGAGGNGVVGISDADTNSWGVWGESIHGVGVVGMTTDGFAGQFFGPVVVTGFVGTTDNRTLELRANNRPAMRYSYAENTVSAGLEYRSTNVLGGSEVNSIGAGVVGATIAGGGLDYFAGTDLPNSVTADLGTVGGGAANTVSGNYATVGGGNRNTALGDYSFAAGYKAKANHNGAFVWGDSTDADFASTGINQFLIRAGGGVGINTANPAGYALNVNGITQITASNPFPHLKVTATAAAPYGAFLSLDATATTGGSDWYLFSTGGSAGEGQGKLAFRNISSGAYGMVFDSTGRVGMGTTGPQAKLHISDSSFPTILTESNATVGTWLRLLNTSAGGHSWNVISSGSGNGEGAGKLLFNDQTIGGTRMTIDGGGNVGIGYFSPLYKLHVNGTVAGVGNYLNTSDARYKTHVTTFPNALDTILNLRGVTFDWKQKDFPDMNFSQGKQIGFIAQEIEKILPELVSTDSKGYKSVAYANVVPVLVEAVKTQQKQMETMKKDNAELKAKNEALEARLNALAEAVRQLQNDRK